MKGTSTALTLLSLLPSAALAGNVISTNGFSSCLQNGTIQVNKLDIKFDRTTNNIQFNVAGTSQKQQNVTASLVIDAYGEQIYQKDFDPCGGDVHVPQLCPGKSPRKAIATYLSLICQ